MLKDNVDYKVAGYKNTWSVIDRDFGYVLLENNYWGDETCYLVVKEDAEVVEDEYHRKSTGETVIYNTIITTEIFETYDGIEICLEDEGIL